MRIAIFAAGTRGDLQPAATIGAELAGRGHSVAAVVNRDQADWVRRFGLEVHPTGVDVAGFLNSADGQQLLADGRFATLSRQIAGQDLTHNESIMDACAAAADGAEVVLSTFAMAYRGVAVGTAAGIPTATLTYWPSHPAADWASMLSPVRDLRLGLLNRATTAMMHRLFWRQNHATVDQMCDRLMIPRFGRRPRWEDGTTLNAFSTRLVPPPVSAAAYQAIGPIVLPPELRSLLGETELTPALDAWLDDGPPPVYFGFGSMPVLDPPALLDAVAEITARRGIRGLIGAGWSAYDVSGLPGHLFVAAEALDHDRILARCRAAVHHGGAGTTAAVLRAGLPAVVLSLFADQPFWGWRLARTGAGVTMPYRSFTPGRLGAALDRILTDAYAGRARLLAASVRAEDGREPAADAIEELARSGLASTGRETKPR
jgi:sterol 3beta-glucosyltransferase